MSTYLEDAARNYPHIVYRVYDAEDRLLYVGLTADIQDRLSHLTALCNMGKHPNGHIRRYGARVTVQPFATKAAGRAAEQSAITAEAPLLNVYHNKGRGLRDAELDAWVATHRPTPVYADLGNRVTLHHSLASAS